jgi:hypothetical protein
MEVVAVGIGFDHRPWLDRKDGADLDLGKLLLAGGQRLIEDDGLRQPSAIVEPHARPDTPGRLSCGNASRRSF